MGTNYCTISRKTSHAIEGSYTQLHANFRFFRCPLHFQTVINFDFASELFERTFFLASPEVESSLQPRAALKQNSIEVLTGAFLGICDGAFAFEVRYWRFCLGALEQVWEAARRMKNED